jgi:NADH:ubiquinone oxidoreductase subunit 6 (subunit J)
VLIQYWPILIPVILGFAAVYLLLPRAQRFPPLYGAVTAALALLAAGWLLIHADMALPETILFYAFAGPSLTFGTLMISQRNPVHAALSFAMVVLSSCGLFLLQAAPFLMVATIIIYAGAIIVTFLFVIMLAQQQGLSSADQRSREPFLATVAGFVLLGSLLCVLQRTYSGIDHYVEQAQRASQVATVKEWQVIFGGDDRFFSEFRRAVQPVRPPRSLDTRDTIGQNKQNLADALDEAQATWNQLKREETAESAKGFQKQLQEIAVLAVAVRDRQGELVPAARPLSTFSGPLPGTPAPTGKDGKPAERLPAANVAGLGKTLFTDYLLAVELAGTLLLVATVGAIAIAARRPEGLR